MRLLGILLMHLHLHTYCLVTNANISVLCKSYLDLTNVFCMVLFCRPVEQRLQALWMVLDKLPKLNYNNLR